MSRTNLLLIGRLAAILLVVALVMPVTTALADNLSQTGVTATTTVNLRIRSGPGTTFAQVGLAGAGETVQVLGRNADSSWIYVDYGGTRGWMAAWYCRISGNLASVPVTAEQVAAPGAETGVTATTTVNLRIRSGPGTTYGQIGLAVRGTVVPVLGRSADNAWVYIDRNGLRGWMMAMYTTIGGSLASVPVVQPGGEPAGAAPPPAPAPTGGVTATTTVNLRLRGGPGTEFAQVDIVPVGRTLTVEGRNAASNWVFVNYNGKPGWLAAWYCTISGNLASVPVTAAAAPAPAPAPAPSGPAGFELGGQTHTFANPGLMRSAGMTWVKFQQKWTPGQNPNEVAGRINAAHAQGFKVLIALTGPEFPSSIDFNAFTNYVAGVAALGADGIEVWNEMNLDREWPRGTLSPAGYVNNMLRPAYQAIKAANPNTLVIAGALSPTGVNIPGVVISDDIYLAGMRDAGAANYMDCLGVHYNAGATSPDATSGHPGGGHYSWYFGATYNLYAGTFPTKPLCYTELGYLTPAGYGPLPSGFAWAANNTLDNHAQWLGRAVQLLRASGRTRLAIIFNVDFTLYTGSDPQAGYAILRPGGSCPACGTLANAMR